MQPMNPTTAMPAMIIPKEGRTLLANTDGALPFMCEKLYWCISNICFESQIKLIISWSSHSKNIQWGRVYYFSGRKTLEEFQFWRGKLLYFPLACGSGGNSLLRYLQALSLFSKLKLLLLLLLQGQLNKCWCVREGEAGQHPALAPAAGGEPCSKQMLGDFHSSQSPTPLSSRGVSSYSFTHWIKQEWSSQEYGYFITCI